MKLIESLTYEPVELGFGTSGLRGLVADMTDLECYINAAGFLRFLVNEGELKPGSKVYVAGDLRDSTPRILAAVAAAVTDGGYEFVNCGLIPTPALAAYALKRRGAAIMVTGSHIPADRNGIKFYKTGGEILKSDESAIKAAVAAVRSEVYAEIGAKFATDGTLASAPGLGEALSEPADEYQTRYERIFSGALAGRTVVFYQHSAVGRDLLVKIFEALGATVVPVGRSDVFIPIDSENVKPADQAYFRKLAAENPRLFAIVSTDGDSDRPFVIDETGEFHRGDVLGAVVAAWLEADFAAYPVSTSDAVDADLSAKKIQWKHTKIGSPYVIAAMQEAQNDGGKRPVGWEVNGGFLTGADLMVRGQQLTALPTRDAALPIIVALVAAVEAGRPVSEVFAALPQRFTQAGLIDNFPVVVARALIQKFSSDTPETRSELAKYFSQERGFGGIKKLNALDGVRIYFDNGDVAHLRPSGNAPQLRIYSVADTQVRADEIVELALAEPDGIFRQLGQTVQ